MGATLARLLVSHGQHVGWVSEGRSDSTRRRATEAGLLDLDSLDHLKDTCAVVLSVCPPRAAVDVARGMHGYSGLYVDVNAVSPGTTQRIGEIICVGGGGYVDGGIIGPPPDRPGTTRLYLSGSAAAAVAALFFGSRLDPLAGQPSPPGRAVRAGPARPKRLGVAELGSGTARTSTGRPPQEQVTRCLGEAFGTGHNP